MSKPRVSIGMPVYNGEKYLAEALDSLLAQTYGDLELIISDNASTDRTQEICQSYVNRDRRVKYFRNEVNLGATRNYNRVFELSGGEYFKWAAHDDIHGAAFVEKCVAALDANPTVSLAFTQRKLIEHDGTDSTWTNEDLPSYHAISFAKLVRLRGHCFPIFAFGLNRSNLLRQTRGLGAFAAADLVQVLEMRLRGDFYEVPEPLFIQRLHDPQDPLWISRVSSKRGEAAWFDPAHKAKMKSAAVRLFKEHLIAIKLSPLSPLRKAGCYAAMSGYLWGKLRHRIRSGSLLRRIGEEFKTVLKFGRQPGCAAPSASK